jgi:hypothetical protein
LTSVFASDFYRTVGAPNEINFSKESNFELHVGEVQVKWDKAISAKP